MKKLLFFLNAIEVKISVSASNKIGGDDSVSVWFSLKIPTLEDPYFISSGLIPIKYIIPERIYDISAYTSVDTLLKEYVDDIYINDIQRCNQIKIDLIKNILKTYKEEEHRKFLMNLKMLNITEQEILVHYLYSINNRKSFSCYWPIHNPKEIIEDSIVVIHREYREDDKEYSKHIDYPYKQIQNLFNLNILNFKD